MQIFFDIFNYPIRFLYIIFKSSKLYKIVN